MAAVTIAPTAGAGAGAGAATAKTLGTGNDFALAGGGSIPLTEVSNALRSINLPSGAKKRVKKYLELVAREAQKQYNAIHADKSGSAAAAPKVIVDRTHVLGELGSEFANYIGNFGKLKQGHGKPPTVESILESLRDKGVHASKDRVEKILNDSLSLPKRRVREDVQETIDNLVEKYVETKYGGKKQRPQLQVLFRDICADHPEWFGIGRGRGLSKQTLEDWIAETNAKARMKAPYIVSNIIEDIREERAQDATLSEKEKERRVTVREVSERLNAMDVDSVPRQELQALVRGSGHVVDAFLQPLTFTEFDDVMTYIYYDRRMMLGRDRLLDFFATLTPESLATFVKPWRDSETQRRRRLPAAGTGAGATASPTEDDVDDDDATPTDAWDMNKSTVVGRIKSSNLNPHELPSVFERVRSSSVVLTTPSIFLSRMKLTINKRRVMAWLKAQEVHQIFLPVKVKRTFAPTILKEPYSQIGIDLISLEFAQSDGTKLTSSGGFVFVLTAVDMFSKRAFAVPLLNKSAESVLSALRFLFQTSKAFPKGSCTVTELELYPRFRQHPRVIRSDNGTEFTNADITAYFANETAVFPSLFAKKAATSLGRTKQLFSLPYTPQSNGAIERFNKFLKRQLNMFTTQTDNQGTWVEALPRILQAYNATKSRITGLSPEHIERIFMSRGPPVETDEMLAWEKKQEEKRAAAFNASTKSKGKAKSKGGAAAAAAAASDPQAKWYATRVAAAKQTRAELEASFAAVGKSLATPSVFAEIETDESANKLDATQARNAKVKHVTAKVAERMKIVAKDLYDALAPQFKSLAGSNLCDSVKVGDIVRLHQYLTKNMGENWSRALYRVYAKQCKSNGKGPDATPLSRPLVRVQLIGRSNDANNKYIPLPLSDPDVSAVMVSSLLKNRMYLAEIGGVWFFVLTRQGTLLQTKKAAKIQFWTPMVRGSERGTWRREDAIVGRVITRATPVYFAAPEEESGKDDKEQDEQQEIVNVKEAKFRSEDVGLFYELNGIEDRLYHEHEILKVDAVMNQLKSEPKYIVQRLVRPVLVTKKNVVLKPGENTRQEECYPYYIVKWSGYTKLTKEPRINLPMSMVKRFEARMEIKWVFANNKQDLATDVNAGKLSGKALTYLENEIYKEEEEDAEEGEEGDNGGTVSGNILTVGDFFTWKHDKKMFIGQIAGFVHGNKTTTGDRFEEAIDASKSKRDIVAHEWKLKALPSKNQKLATFVLNPLKVGGTEQLTIIRRTDVVVKQFIPADYNPETDDVVVEKSFAKEKGLLHMI